MEGVQCHVCLIPISVDSTFVTFFLVSPKRSKQTQLPSRAAAEHGKNVWPLIVRFYAVGALNPLRALGAFASFGAL